MDISFCAITKDNWEQCCALAVSAAQSNFVAPNVYSLVLSKFEPEMCPLGVCIEGKMVGFVMYVKDSSAEKVWIVRFMIDGRYQGKGYGSEALRRIIALFGEEFAGSAVYLCVEPENAAAIRLYEREGFQPTGELWGKELVYRRPAV